MTHFLHDTNTREYPTDYIWLKNHIRNLASDFHRKKTHSLKILYDILREEFFLTKENFSRLYTTRFKSDKKHNILKLSNLRATVTFVQVCKICMVPFMMLHTYGIVCHTLTQLQPPHSHSQYIFHFLAIKKNCL